MKVAIVYWSGTGNTEAMASSISEGAKGAGADVVLKQVSEASVEDILQADIAVLGCPSMGDEVLEESEFEPFIQSIIDKVSGKNIALFGSYGWGDGQWMREWEEQMKNAGANLVAEPLIVNEAPTEDDIDDCRALGKSLV